MSIVPPVTVTCCGKLTLSAICFRPAVVVLEAEESTIWENGRHAPPARVLGRYNLVFIPLENGEIAAVHHEPHRMTNF